MVFFRSRGHLAPSSYNETEANVFAEYARATFCDTQSQVQWNCGESCQTAPVVPNSVRPIGPGLIHGAVAYVAQIPTKKDAIGEAPRCIVAFRGSIGVRNWFADAEAWT